MERGSWAFEKNLIALSLVEKDENPTLVDLNWVDFYVHVHNLPIGQMTKDMAEFIGNQLGFFCDVELGSIEQYWRSPLRIHVGLNVNKSLKRILKICMALGTERLILFTYERCPTFVNCVNTWSIS